jgi:hypothetical protein
MENPTWKINQNELISAPNDLTEQDAAGRGEVPGASGCAGLAAGWVQLDVGLVQPPVHNRVEANAAESKMEMVPLKHAKGETELGADTVCRRADEESKKAAEPFGAEELANTTLLRTSCELCVKTAPPDCPAVFPTNRMCDMFNEEFAAETAAPLLAVMQFRSVIPTMVTVEFRMFQPLALFSQSNTVATCPESDLKRKRSSGFVSNVLKFCPASNRCALDTNTQA